MINRAPLLNQFQQALVDCRLLYVSSAQLCIQQHPHLLQDAPQEFLQMMGDLHKGLLIKIYVTVAEADKRWSPEEQELAECLFKHLWRRSLTGQELRDAAMHVSRESDQLEWLNLVRPFQQIAPLRDRVGDLETIVMRVANLVAKVDGEILPSETTCLRCIQQELDQHLRDNQLDQPGHHERAERIGSQAIQTIKAGTGVQGSPSPHPEPPPKPPEQVLSEALEQLDQLVGLDNVKQQVRTLTNFLKLQRERELRGLPRTTLSLHMVFCGNPGSGKTTVARIVGQIYGAMGILKKGHLVETDRSGLVASYSGQTASKANSKIDEALDGVLFIDEAYSLVAESSEDPYGHEAVQALLKRMEDDRERLVVILAGYPQPMDRLLKCNPGLSSRFATHLHFEDYEPEELGSIFELMCNKNQYTVRGLAQAKLMLAFHYLYERRDEHFGNGRMVRNVFERSIRRLANRIVKIVPLTQELLTVIQAEDVDVPDVPSHLWAELPRKPRFQVHCAGCENLSRVPATYLGKRVRCKKCGERFIAAWGEPSDAVD